MGTDASPDVTTSDATNDVAQTGDSAVDGSGDASDGALPPLSITPMVALGYGFSCSLRSTGRIYCWGVNSEGQFGNLTTSSGANATPTQVANITNAAVIGAGVDFVCALLTDHTVSCWGGNGTSQLGQVASTDNATPTPVSGLTDVIELEVGGSHVCVRKNDSSVWCWGSNGSDQLGYNNSTDTACANSIPCNPTPTKVAGLTADGLAAGLAHTCARVGTTAECWGANDAAQLGHVPGQDGDTSGMNPTPVAAAATGVGGIFAGGDVTCAINGTQQVSCWGKDAQGQLGDMGTGQSADPVNVPGLTIGTQVAPGWVSSCGVSNTSVYCWGDNVGCDEGNGTNGGTDLGPAIATGLSISQVQVTSDMVGAHHCAIDTSAVVTCWGENEDDELGHSNTTDPTCGGSKGNPTPTAVSGLP
jgi:alpha-tubulin suppressor-like RCC1 family protein